MVSYRGEGQMIDLKKRERDLLKRISDLEKGLRWVLRALEDVDLEDPEALREALDWTRAQLEGLLHGRPL